MTFHKDSGTWTEVQADPMFGHMSSGPWIPDLHNNPMHLLYKFYLLYAFENGKLTLLDPKPENFGRSQTDSKAIPDKRVNVELGQKFHNFNILNKNFSLDDSRDS